MKEEQKGNKDISPSSYLLALSWKIFLLSVPQHPYCILVTMCVMEKFYSYRPSYSFCILHNVGGFYMPLFMLANSLSAISAYSVFYLLSCFSFCQNQASMPMIAMVFPEFLVLIGWIIQKLSHNRKTLREMLLNFMFLSHPAS